jgi:hypothetical protein
MHRYFDPHLSYAPSPIREALDRESHRRNVRSRFLGVLKHRPTMHFADLWPALWIGITPHQLEEADVDE